MDFKKASTFLDRIWDDEIIPALTDYIRIPNKSPAFDKDWAAHGHMEKATQMFAAWANAKLTAFPGSRLEVVRLEGRTPLIFIEIPGAAPGTVLAVANGVVDENYWLAAYLNGKIDNRSSFSTNVYANWFQSGIGPDSSAIGATAAYYRHLTDHISASAAVGIDGTKEDAPFDDFWTASALFGVRYNF